MDLAGYVHMCVCMCICYNNDQLGVNEFVSGCECSVRVLEKNDVAIIKIPLSCIKL